MGMKQEKPEPKKQPRQIILESGEKVFNTKTHHFDPKTGKLSDLTPYILVIDRGNKIFIDKKSGEKFYENGDPVLEQAAATLPDAAPVAPVAPAEPVKPAAKK